MFLSEVKKENSWSLLTCESLSPSLSASFFSIWFGDVLLFLEGFLESFPLQVGEDGSSQHSSPGFTPHVAQQGERIGHR